MSSTNSLKDLVDGIDRSAEANEHLERAMDRVLVNRARPAFRLPRVVHHAALSCAAALLVLVGFAAGRHHGDATLTYTIRGAANDTTFIDAREDTPIVFSDGTRVDVQRGGQARIATLGPDGASLALESGKAHLAVVHKNARTHWNVEAGPFAVHVTGTAFDVAWDPNAHQMSLHMEEGRVEITGCNTDKSMRAGDTSTFTCPPPELGHARAANVPALEPTPPGTPKAPEALTAAPATTIAETAPIPSVTTLVALSPSASASQGAVVATPATTTTWRTLYREGRYPDAYALVTNDFDTRVGAAPASELLALAELARLAEHPSRAQEAYDALRSRFGHTPEAAEAAFQLARIAFDRSLYDAAARGFETYRIEAPRGPWEREALGRLVESLARAGQSDRAREAARSYLQTYPEGPHAAAAHRVLGDLR